MAQLTTGQYDALERAVERGRRIAVLRRGTEYVVIPLELRLRDGREFIRARHPTTGEEMEFGIDEIDDVEVIA